jgi:hypothetical protein
MQRSSRILTAILWAFAILGLNSISVAEETRPLILAHYMPWYTAQPVSERWGWHWTMDHFDPEQQVDGRREIASKFYPLIGPYDSGDVHVLEYHLLTMKLAGIDGVIVDWYGLTDYRDYAILHRNTTRLLQQCERLGMKFVICYEDQTIPALVESQRIKESDRVAHAVSEINWLHKYWFQSPSYVRFDGEPVMLSFGHAGLTDAEWSRALRDIDSPILYYSQGYRRDGAVGGFGWPVPQQGMEHNDRFLAGAGQWPDSIPVAFPRFVDIYGEAGVGDGYPPLPDQGGTTFRQTVTKAVNAKTRMIQIATWNDWGEGTQIEPSREFGYRDLTWVQRTRRQLDSDFSNRPEDLQLPRQLLNHRRAAEHPTEKLDAVRDAILAGDLAQVQDRLDTL